LECCDGVVGAGAEAGVCWGAKEVELGGKDAVAKVVVLLAGCEGGLDGGEEVGVVGWGGGWHFDELSG
jgi:hypothetical protein